MVTQVMASTVFMSSSCTTFVLFFSDRSDCPLQLRPLHHQLPPNWVCFHREKKLLFRPCFLALNICMQLSCPFNPHLLLAGLLRTPQSLSSGRTDLNSRDRCHSDP